MLEPQSVNEDEDQDCREEEEFYGAPVGLSRLLVSRSLGFGDFGALTLGLGGVNPGVEELAKDDAAGGDERNVEQKGEDAVDPRISCLKDRIFLQNLDHGGEPGLDFLKDGENIVFSFEGCPTDCDGSDPGSGGVLHGELMLTVSRTSHREENVSEVTNSEEGIGSMLLVAAM